MRLGIDLGGSKIEIVALDEAGEIHFRRRIPAPQNNYQATLDALCQLVQQTEANLSASSALGGASHPAAALQAQPATIGIGIPGCISPATGRVKNANSVWLIGHPLQQDLSTALGREIRIANDADCFALSEASDGAGANYASVFGVILGTGTGGGLVINQQLVAGPNAISGEWGHNPLPWARQNDSALACYCGKKGCIETYLSGPGFRKQFQLLGGEDSYHPKDIMRARQTNPLAERAYQDLIDRMARSLASVINIVDPHAIVLGGGLSNIESLYIDLPPLLPKYVFSDQVCTPILKAKYGDSSGVRGAAWLWPAASNHGN